MAAHLNEHIQSVQNSQSSVRMVLYYSVTEVRLSMDALAHSWLQGLGKYAFPSEPFRTDIVQGLFYPFGNGDIRSPSTDDGSSPEIILEKPFVYFGQIYQKTHVNNNGHLTFDGPLSQATPSYLQTQFNRDIIAPLWTDMDNRVSGTISYRQVTSGGLLLAASNNINQYFPNLNFNASWLFIATWDKVPYFARPQSESTFQVVLVSGKNMSFTLMHYGPTTQTTYRFMSGYDTRDSTDFFFIPVSDITKLSNTSNVNFTGRWVFRVDRTSDHNENDLSWDHLGFDHDAGKTVSRLDRDHSADHEQDFAPGRVKVILHPHPDYLPKVPFLAVHPVILEAFCPPPFTTPEQVKSSVQSVLFRHKSTALASGVSQSSCSSVMVVVTEEQLPPGRPCLTGSGMLLLWLMRRAVKHRL
ncbi:uncharacterized protein LOC132120924 [Carassius carassius]|uniref:uncharacterized protein LOC132120924 n=1 Tax=Carassius carassius TaxID=217509 RepID=UPI002868E89F|nr:uncharacterized protein LOC132120924 [Carassius carassius]